MADEVGIVHQWHNALNGGEIEQLIALVHPEVEVGGPRGSAAGAQVMREWVGRANVRLYPLRAFHKKGVVVVEEQGEWLAPESGQVAGSQVVATVFGMDGGRITRVIRYDDLASALAAAGLTAADQV